MNRTSLVAAVALGLGLLLACGGSVVLAHARAAVRADHPRRGSITQYPAALSALMGFLLTSVAGAVLCWRLAPGGGTTAALVAIVAGVILFALVGALFARVADRVEERRLRQVPHEVHRPISAPPRRTALTAAPAARAANGSSAERRAIGPADRLALSAANSPAAPRGSGARPLLGSAEHPAIGPAEGRPSRSIEPAPDVEPGPIPRPRPPSDPPPFGYSTPLVPVPPRVPSADAGGTERPDGTGGSASEDPATPDDAPEPAPTAEATVEATPAAAEPDLVPGWMYHDEADSWFLVVGTPGGTPALLGLPAFALVAPGGPGAPVGTLMRAGAAELTVVPEQFPISGTSLIGGDDVRDGGEVSDVVADTPSNPSASPTNSPSDPGKGEAG
ncbi:hypothetical protein [Cryptosporangium minutisporangium]|uniref:Uncharacterized protein n=1 Tax=Cryptosporangium minutisporangium TaxID=113569 RepID=A0ABP6SQC1_9ACTN